METIGIIAGRDNFPILFAQEARKAGYKTAAIAIKNNTRSSLKYYVDRIQWLDISEFKKIPEILKTENIRKVALAGQINPNLLFKPKLMRNPQIQSFFSGVGDRRADTIFKAFAKDLELEGLELLNSTIFLSGFIPQERILTKSRPSEDEMREINFGFKLAKHLGIMDIGQSVCVKNGVVLAVESIEGTDNTIRRAIGLARSAIVLVKVSKPSQDIRFDVPVVGARTIRNLVSGSCLAIEADRTLFLEQNEAIRAADKKGIKIIAVVDKTT